MRFYQFLWLLKNSLPLLTNARDGCKGFRRSTQRALGSDHSTTERRHVARRCVRRLADLVKHTTYRLGEESGATLVQTIVSHRFSIDLVVGGAC